jgi:hypothetical protein
MTKPEGSEIEQLTSLVGLNQLLKEPTEYEPYKWPSCINLMFTDQSNSVMEGGTRSTHHNFCHHQISYCRMNFQVHLLKG